ncbi:MAG: C39 family peptidase [Treponema sp.]|nr:C39 family peptidase [Treponema sp.]
MKKGKHKKILIALLTFVLILMAIIAALTIRLKIRTHEILNDYTGIYQDEKYSTPVFIDGIQVIKQDVSCGYAVIEMISTWSGHDITEESLYSEYGKVVTSTGNAFCNEMNKQFPEYKTTMHKYLKNTELIDIVYKSLANGKPVPFEWAALYEDDWTLHYSLITGIDVPADKIQIANPYGYYETISVEEFLDRTSFESYKGIPLFLKLGFAVDIFEKNTVFIME